MGSFCSASSTAERQDGCESLQSWSSSRVAGRAAAVKLSGKLTPAMPERQDSGRARSLGATAAFVSPALLRALPGCARLRAGRVSRRSRGRSGRPAPRCLPSRAPGSPGVFPRRGRKRRTRTIRRWRGPSPPRSVWAAPRARREPEAAC